MFKWLKHILTKDKGPSKFSNDKLEEIMFELGVEEFMLDDGAARHGARVPSFKPKDIVSTIPGRGPRRYKEIVEEVGLMRLHGKTQYAVRVGGLPYYPDELILEHEWIEPSFKPKDLVSTKKGVVPLRLQQEVEDVINTDDGIFIKVRELLYKPEELVLELP